jgi:hypothetical protein
MAMPTRSYASTIHGHDRHSLGPVPGAWEYPFPPLRDSVISNVADCAVEEVAGASDDHSSWRTPVTIILVLGLFAGLYLLWLLFNLAAHALPLYVGLGLCVWLLHHGHGYVASISAGFLIGVVTLTIGQLLFDTVRSPTLRLMIAVLFVVPAGLAGYQLVYGIAGLAIERGVALTLLSVAGGGFITSSAWRQLVSPSFAARHSAVREGDGIVRSSS